MLEIFRKFKIIFDNTQIKKSFLLLFVIFIGVLLEMLGIGLIIPILSLLAGQEENSFLDFEKFTSFFSFLNISSYGDLILLSIYLLLIVYFLKTAFSIFLVWFQSKFVYHLQASISYKLFKTYLFQNYIFHIRKNSSELIQNVTNEVERFVNAFFLSVIIFVTELFIVIGISAVLIMFDPIGFSVIFILFGGASLIFIKSTRKFIKKWGIQRQFHQTLCIQHIQQGLRNIKDVKILGKEMEFIEYFKFHIGKFTEIEGNILFLRTVPRHVLEFIAVLTLVFAINVLVLMNYELSSVLITLGVFVAAALKILPSMNRIINTFVSAKYSFVTINTIYRDLSLNYKIIEDKKVQKAQLKFRENIKLEKLFYKYPESNKLILNNINLEIKNNTIVGLIGESGSGKTTFIDLIIGFLEPSEGKILVDNQNIFENRRIWQNNIGYIPQFIYLTDDTIKRNIALGEKNEKINEEKIRNALRISQMNKFINDLPLKEDTKVGEFGVKLSGGQRQRIGIARALYNAPNLLVMDEATNSLDEKTEEEIMNSIYLMKGKKTILISAHKKSILEKCNVILKFDKGNITTVKNLNT